jgi:mitochondrial protein import protein ZIM17
MSYGPRLGRSESSGIDPVGPAQSGVMKIDPSLGVSTIEKFLMMYTCKICDGRNAHMVSKVAYNCGMVVTTCRHCKNRHLIADNENKLDMGPDTPAFQKVEELLKMRGENVQRMQVNSKQDLIEGRYLVEQDGDSINIVDLRAAVDTLDKWEKGEGERNGGGGDDDDDGEGGDNERKLRFITRPIDMMDGDGDGGSSSTGGE